MACRITGRKKIMVSSALNPEYLEVTKTYVHASDLQLDKLNLDDGATLQSSIDEETAAVIVQYPNYFGIIEDLRALVEIAHKAKALLIVVSDPISLGYLSPPGDFNVDIVVGDAQPCGNSLSFGGPSAGFMACRKEFLRQLPGRLVGGTLDSCQRPAYTLTLQAREQHIRRAGATSNICTNQALNALAMLVYLCAVGPEGIKSIANLSWQKAHYLADKLTEIPGVKLAFRRPYFSEFAIVTPKPASHVLKQLANKGILGGLSLGESAVALQTGILIAVTEMNKKDELDAYARELQSVLNMQ
jgi:glycine dehydrogenase subunit 1